MMVMITAGPALSTVSVYHADFVIGLRSDIRRLDRRRYCDLLPYLCAFAAAPKLQSDMKLESTRTLKAGVGLVQQFTVSGVPVPSVTWSLNGQSLDGTPVISSTPEMTSLSVKKCSVKDAGQYEVTASNEVGSDTVRFNVVVNGP